MSPADNTIALATTCWALAVSRARDKYSCYVIALTAATQLPCKDSLVITPML